MNIIFILCLCLLFVLYLREKKNSSLQKEQLFYISERLESIMEQSSQEYLHIPTSNEGIKRLSASTYRLLYHFYKEQTRHEQFQKSMEKVLTNISHDLKTPLTVISGYTEIMLQKSVEFDLPLEIEQLIQKLDEKTKQIVRMIHQFFQLSKLQSGDSVLSMQNMEIGKVCREVLLEYYDLLEKKRFQVNFPDSESPYFANANEDALVRILKNLIDNAIKYGEEGRYLEVLLKEKEQKITISVIDHGKGIRMEEQVFIFLRTYRERKNHVQNVSGSGIGLAIAKHLAEQMGGSISVKSNQQDETIFTLELMKS